MRTKVNRIAQTVVFGAAVLVALSCNSVNRESSPVKLVVTNDQALHQIDLLIVLDPPAFAKSQKAVPAALDGYASLHRAAFEVLEIGRAHV